MCVFTRVVLNVTAPHARMWYYGKVRPKLVEFHARCLGTFDITLFTLCCCDQVIFGYFDVLYGSCTYRCNSRWRLLFSPSLPPSLWRPDMWNLWIFGGWGLKEALWTKRSQISQRNILPGFRHPLVLACLSMSKGTCSSHQGQVTSPHCRGTMRAIWHCEQCVVCRGLQEQH